MNHTTRRWVVTSVTLSLCVLYVKFSGEVREDDTGALHDVWTTPQGDGGYIRHASVMCPFCNSQHSVPCWEPWKGLKRLGNIAAVRCASFLMVPYMCSSSTALALGLMDTGETHFSAGRSRRFWVSGYCTKWRIQGHSWSSRSLTIKT